MRHVLPSGGLTWILVVIIVAAVLGACRSGGDQPAEPAPGTAPTATPEAEDSVPPVDSGLIPFVIDKEQSEARFIIDEVLLGSDNTVIGVTSHITGEVYVDPVDPSRTEISRILVDARDLTTDNSRRNRSIQRFILRSAVDENRHIVFEPTAIDGLPAAVSVGSPFDFTVSGDLTVRDSTQPVTFELTVTANSEDEITGLGTATILYSDFGISIPSVPAVASVEDEVLLEVEFTAVAK